MTFAILGRTALLATRRTSVATTSQQARRRMGSSAPAQEWTGIDKVVRSYFPKDEQRELNTSDLWGRVVKGIADLVPVASFLRGYYLRVFLISPSKMIRSLYY